MPSLADIDPRKIWKNYVLALALIFALVTTSHFAGVIVGGDSAVMAADINKSGRQRMLSQRILNYANLYSASDLNDSVALSSMRIAHSEFQAAYHDLLVRAQDPRLLEIYFGSGEQPGLAEKIDAFLAAGDILISGNQEQRELAILEMNELGATELLVELNNAVAIYQALAEENAALVEHVSLIGYSLAILALFLEAFLIFRPAHRTIVQAFDEVAEANDALRQREKEAFSALEETEEAWAFADASKTLSEQAQIEMSNRMERIGHEISAPLAATELSLKYATASTSPKDQMNGIVKATRFSGIALDMCQALLEKDLSVRGADTNDKPCAPSEVLNTAMEVAASVVPKNIKLRIDMGNQRMPPVICDPLDLFRLTVHMIREAAQNAGDDDTSISVSIDSELIERDLHLRISCQSALKDKQSEIDIGVEGFSVRVRKASADEALSNAIMALSENLNGSIDMSVKDGTRTTHAQLKIPANRSFAPVSKAS